MKRNLARRIPVMLLGLLISAFGVSFSIKAELGASTLGCCPAVYSGPLHLSVGTVLWIMSVLFVLIQLLVLRREFPPFQLLQFVLSFLYGYLTDFTSAVIAPLPDGILGFQILYCALGILGLAVGIYMVLVANLLMVPIDAMINVISCHYRIPYVRVKITVDCILVAIAVAGSLLLYHRLYQVGVGTFAAAFLVGLLIGALQKSQRLTRLLGGTPETAPENRPSQDP